MALAGSPISEPDATGVLDEVIANLGSPYYRCGNVALFQTDCVQALAQLAAGSVDLTVTSPPYNIGKEYERAQSLESYLEWCGLWCAEIARVTNQHGSFWLNIGYTSLHQKAKALPLAYLMWDRVPMYLIQEVVWHYGAGVAARRSFSPRNEKWLWFVKDHDLYQFDLDSVRDPDVKYPHQKKNGKLKCNPAGKNPSDVWSIPKVTSGAGRSSPERTPHPAQFPSALVDRIVRASSALGDVVLDPFVGSGTTAVVAQQLGRPFIGFDISAKYLATAADRLDRLRGSGTQLALLGPQGN